MKNDILLKQVELFIAFLKKLDYSEIGDLENGAMKINFVKERHAVSNLSFDNFTYSQYVIELQSKITRDECFDYFEMANLQKKDLEGILKYLGVSFSKKDTKYKLKTKIIENTIGKKLRDDAIINK